MYRETRQKATHRLHPEESSSACFQSGASSLLLSGSHVFRCAARGLSAQTTTERTRVREKTRRASQFFLTQLNCEETLERD